MPNTNDNAVIPIEHSADTCEGKVALDYSSDDTFEYTLDTAYSLESSLSSLNLLSSSPESLLPSNTQVASAAYHYEEDESSSNNPSNENKDGYDWQIQAGTITLQFYTELAPFGRNRPLPELVGRNDIYLDGLASQFEGIRWVINGHGRKQSNQFELPELTLITPADLRWPFVTNIDRDYHLEKDFKLGLIKPLQNGQKWKFYHKDEMINDIELSPWQGFSEFKKFSKRLLTDEQLWSNIDNETGLFLNRDPHAILIVKCGIDRYLAKQGNQITSYLESIIENNDTIPLGDVPLLFMSPRLGKIKVLSPTKLSEVSSIVSKVDSEPSLLCASCNALKQSDRLIAVDTNASTVPVSVISREYDKRLLDYSRLLDHFIKHDANLAHKAAIRLHGEMSQHIEHGPLIKNQATYDFEMLIRNLLLDEHSEKIQFEFKNNDCHLSSTEFNLSLTQVLQAMNWHFIDAQSFSNNYEQYVFFNSTFKPRTIKCQRIFDKVDFELPSHVHSQLTFGEMIALNIYTQESTCSGVGKSLYAPLNHLLWSNETELDKYRDNPNELKDLLIHACFVASAINHADRTQRKFAYRVEGSLPDHVFQARKQAAIDKRPYYEGGFISTSGSSQCAMDAKGGELLTHQTIFHDVTGIDLRWLSYYGLKEDEILIPPGPIQYDHLSTRDYLSVSIAHPVLTPMGLNENETLKGVGHFDECCYFEFHGMLNLVYADLETPEKQLVAQFLQGYHPLLLQCFTYSQSDHVKSRLFYDILSKALFQLETSSLPDPLIHFRKGLKSFIEYNPIFAALDTEYFEQALCDANSIDTVREVVEDQFIKAMNSRCGGRWIYDAQGFVYTNDELREILRTIEYNSIKDMQQCAIYDRIPSNIRNALHRVLDNAPQPGATPSEDESRVLRLRSHSF